MISVGDFEAVCEELERLKGTVSVTCIYCNEEAPLAHSREIYGRDYGWVYWC